MTFFVGVFTMEFFGSCGGCITGTLSVGQNSEKLWYDWVLFILYGFFGFFVPVMQWGEFFWARSAQKNSNS
jgi:hypothetical protein